MTCDRNALLITCEHAGNDVPDDLVDCFAGRDAARQLHSHRGHDPGALLIAQALSRRLDAPLEFSTVSRLVVDLNRSLNSPQLFSKFIAAHDEPLKRHLLQSYYLPYRKRVTDSIQRQVTAGRSVLHLSVHTFTPRMRGQVRQLDIGVLFDPQRMQERLFSERLIEQLAKCKLRVHPNQPYLGIEDGFTTLLRTQFNDDCYAGIELELNNRIDKRSPQTQTKWIDQIAAAIEIARADF